jgi:hypothetical protein
MRTVYLLLIAFATGCTGFVRIPAPDEHQAPSRQLLEVWSRGHGFLVDDLVVAGDSLRGVLRTDRGAGGAFAIARSEVDSVRTTQRNSVDTGLVIGASVLLIYLYLIRAVRGA